MSKTAVLVPALQAELDGAGGDADQQGAGVVALHEPVLEPALLEGRPPPPHVAAGEQDEVRLGQEREVLGGGLRGDVAAVADVDLRHGGQEQIEELGRVAIGGPEIGALQRPAGAVGVGIEQRPGTVEEAMPLPVAPEQELAVGEQEDGFDRVRHGGKISDGSY